MQSVFLSYSHTDADAVTKIATDLRKNGVDVWLDRENLRVSDSWINQIQSAISEADTVILFISEASLKSKWVQEEYRTAFERMKDTGSTRIIPVLLEKVSLPPFLSRSLYLDFTQSYNQGIEALIRALHAHQGLRPSEVLPITDLAKAVAGEVAKLLGLEANSKSGEATSMDNIDPKLVFVIMSFQADMEPIFEGIKTAASAVGLTAQRVKDVQGDYRITDKIIKMIHAARIIVTDLTHERPNVYFELGYARGLGKTVVTIARDGTNIHFDVKDWNYISYTDSRILERDLKQRFEYELTE